MVDAMVHCMRTCFARCSAPAAAPRNGANRGGNNALVLSVPGGGSNDYVYLTTSRQPGALVAPQADRPRGAD
jgi:hypothetical protein